MFLSILFEEFPLIAHSRLLNEGDTQCTLHLITEGRAADELLEELPPGESAVLEQYLHSLEYVSGEDSFEVCGGAALVLSEFVSEHAEAAIEGHHPCDPELLGFWEPTQKNMPGILMWCADEGYGVAVAHSKEQAEYVLNGLDWLNEEQREVLLTRVQGWSIDRRSPEGVQRIHGISAELLCEASITRRARNMPRMMLH